MFSLRLCGLISHILQDAFLNIQFLLQESSSSLRHELSSNDLNNNDNEFDEDATELGDRIVNSSNGFNQNSMSGSYQYQEKKKQVGMRLFMFQLVTSNCRSINYIVCAVTF